ncbi:MAG: AAA family ATPase, partial [Endomicrobium sp.]|nr:AAA family ATPase [Endomicrobium sp.]
MKDSRKDNQTKQQLQYAKIHAAMWLANLLAAGEVKLCERIFELFDYCTCELKKYLEPILKDVVKLLGHHKKLTRDYTSIQDLLKNKAYIVGRRIEELLFEYPEFENNFAMCMEKYLRRFIKAQKLIIPEDFGKAKETFSSLFGFDEKTIKIIDYMFLKNTYYPLKSGLEDNLSLDKFIGRDALGIALGMSKADIKSRLAELEDLGIINSTIFALNFSSNDIYRVWDVPEGKNPEELFCSPLKGETLPLSDFSVEQNQVNYVMDLLKSNKDEGVHILLYGPPGTGKTTFARSLALTLDVKAWVVVAEKEQNSGERRRMALTVCMNRAGSQKGSIVVVDEAENLLTDRHFLANQGKSIEKGWINEFLEKPGNPVIWIVNYPDMIDQTTIRRFSFAIHFPPLGLKERRRMWEAILKKHELDIPEEATILEKLVKKHKIPAAVIDRAVKQAMEIGGDANVIWENIGISVKSFELLQKGGDKPRLKGELSQGFTLEGVTAEFEARPFIDKLKAIDGLRDKDGLHPGTGTML